MFAHIHWSENVDLKLDQFVARDKMTLWILQQQRSASVQIPLIQTSHNQHQGAMMMNQPILRLHQCPETGIV
jgi:hypothetical protein